MHEPQNWMWLIGKRSALIWTGNVFVQTWSCADIRRLPLLYNCFRQSDRPIRRKQENVTLENTTVHAARPSASWALWPHDGEDRAYPLRARFNFPLSSEPTLTVFNHSCFPWISLCSHRRRNSNVMKIPEGLDNWRLLYRVKRYFRQRKRNWTAEHGKAQDFGLRPASKELSLARKGERSLSMDSNSSSWSRKRWKCCRDVYVTEWASLWKEPGRSSCGRDWMLNFDLNLRRFGSHLLTRLTWWISGLNL